MAQKFMQVGKRVYISDYSPFRGLAGTIQMVDIVAESEDPVCYYLVKLEKAPVCDAVWFLDEEVEAISLRDLDSANKRYS